MKFMGDVMSKSQDVSATELYYSKGNPLPRMRLMMENENGH